MTNNDEMALKLNWLARKAKFGHFDLQEFLTEANPANILALLAERDADKKRIAEQAKSTAFLKEQLSLLANFNPDWDKLEAAYDSLREHMAALNAAQSRIAELEARKVSVKLPKKENEEAIAYGGSGAFRVGRVCGLNEAIDIMSERLAAAGINVEFE